MFIIISPSKTQDFGEKPILENGVISVFNDETKKLAKVMKKFSARDLGEMMKISENLAELNFKRFQNWSGNFRESFDKKKNEWNFKPCIFAFKGDVYKGFDLQNWSKKDFSYAEDNLQIISGFYGLMSPMTYLKPYRLEMGTKIAFKIRNTEYKNLYDFWNEKLTKKLKGFFKRSKSKYILNLASVEYSKALNLKKFDDKVINVDFKVSKNEVEKVVAIFAKRQRGEMTNWIIKNKVETLEELKKYKNASFKYSAKSTKDARKKTGEKNRMVFVWNRKDNNKK